MTVQYRYHVDIVGEELRFARRLVSALSDGFLLGEGIVWEEGEDFLRLYFKLDRSAEKFAKKGFVVIDQNPPNGMPSVVPFPRGTPVFGDRPTPPTTEEQGKNPTRVHFFARIVADRFHQAVCGRALDNHEADFSEASMTRNTTAMTCPECKKRMNRS